MQCRSFSVHQIGIGSSSRIWSIRRILPKSGSRCEPSEFIETASRTDVTLLRDGKRSIDALALPSEKLVSQEEAVSNSHGSRLIRQSTLCLRALHRGITKQTWYYNAFRCSKLHAESDRSAL